MVKLKTFTDFQHTKLYPFENLRLGVYCLSIPKLCKFQPVSIFLLIYILIKNCY